MVVVIIIGVVLVGVAIMGIVAAIAIPNLLTAMERSKQKRTMADVRSLAMSVEAYATDKKVYPHAASMDELAPQISPEYIRTVPRVDAWGTPIRYACVPDDCSGYVIRSAGKDKIFQHEDASEYEKRATTSYDCDLVFMNGSFVVYPEGRGN